MNRALIIILFAFYALKGSAQTNVANEVTGMLNPERPYLKLSNLKENVGKDVYLKGLITGRKALNDSLTHLYIGGVYPNHLLTVILKGKQLNRELAWLTTLNVSIFSGELRWIDNRPTLFITNYSQVCKQILL